MSTPAPDGEHLPRQGHRQGHTPHQPNDRREHPGAALAIPERHRRCVGDGVVREDRDAGEPDGVAQVDGDDGDHHHERNGELGPHRCRALLVDGGEPGRQLRAAGHGEHRPRHAGQQVEQHPERGERGADAHDRLECRPGSALDDQLQRGLRRGEVVDRHDGQGRDGDDRVGGEHEGQRAHDRPRDRPRRIPHLLAQRRNPRVAGECEEEEPGRAQHVERIGVERRQPAHVGVAGPASDDHAGEHRQRDGQDEAGDRGGAGQPAEVDDGDPGHRRDGDDSLRTRPEIRPDGQGDGGARGRLADDEAPAGQESPDRSELTASVDVRAAGLRVHRGEARRRRGVAQRDDGGDAESDQQGGSRRRGRR